MKKVPSASRMAMRLSEAPLPPAPPVAYCSSGTTGGSGAAGSCACRDWLHQRMCVASRAQASECLQGR